MLGGRGIVSDSSSQPCSDLFAGAGFCQSQEGQRLRQTGPVLPVTCRAGARSWVNDPDKRAKTIPRRYEEPRGWIRKRLPPGEGQGGNPRSCGRCSLPELSGHRRL